MRLTVRDRPSYLQIERTNTHIPVSLVAGYLEGLGELGGETQSSCTGRDGQACDVRVPGQIV